MMYHFNATGERRKELVKKVSEILGIPSKYKGMPSAAYQIGDYEVSKDGVLSWADMDDADPEKLDRSVNLIQELEGAGFVSEESSVFSEEAEEESEDAGLSISVPIDKVGVGNLTNLLEAKGDLIMEALGVEDIRISIGEDAVEFPWFSVRPGDADSAQAYTRFIGAICKMSKEQKRISSTKKEVENKKYVFRCFLLRLGFIGSEYKKDRKILLQNFSGSSAFKSGAKKEVDNDAVSE